MTYNVLIGMLNLLTHLEVELCGHAWKLAVCCRDMFCAGRVVEDDLKRTMQACGGSIVTTVTGLNDDVLGTCELFEEKQLGGERSVNS